MSLIFAVTREQFEDGTKTQTRRIVKPGEWYDPERQAVILPSGRIKWQVGKIYSAVPCRGKKAFAKFKILALRAERLQDITEEDARAEGIDEHYFDHAPNFKACIRPGWECRAAYADLWDRLYDKYPDKRISANPTVWVIEFERAA